MIFSDGNITYFIMFATHEEKEHMWSVNGKSNIIFKKI
jgi:hypothetical protein